MLTDFFSEKIVNYGLEGRTLIWPMIISQMQRSIIGDPITEGRKKMETTSVELMEPNSWKPCEALVRIGCKEISRLTQTLIDSLPRLNDVEGIAWINTHCLNLADTISKNIEVESILHTELVRAKIHLDGESDRTGGRRSTATAEKNKRVSTLFGYGHLVGKRVDYYEKDAHRAIDINIVKLDSGAMIYGPLYEIDGTETSTDYDTPSDSYLDTEIGRSPV